MSLKPVETPKRVGARRTRVTLAAIAVKNGCVGFEKQEKLSVTLRTEILHWGIFFAAAKSTAHSSRSAVGWFSTAITRRSMENDASAGTVLILPPGPWPNTPPTLIVGAMVFPSGVTNFRRASERL